MGSISQQLAPESESDAGHLAVKFGEEQERQTLRAERVKAQQQAQADRARQAVDVAKERGLW